MGTPSPERSTAPPLFSAHVYCSQTAKSAILTYTVQKEQFVFINNNVLKCHQTVYNVHVVPLAPDRTARRQFQATGQLVIRTQASDASGRLPRYEAKCVQRTRFQCGSVPLRSGIKGTELPPANILISLERQLTALQICAESFYRATLC